MGQTRENFEKEIRTTLKLDYLLYLPKEYDSKEDWPLVLFLHGAGERGCNLEKVKILGPPKMVEEGKEFPFILVSPQCPDDMWWDSKFRDLYALINYIKTEYKVDDSRIYITGISMGGYGSWEMAIAYPDEFAAVIPLCGGVWRRRFLGRIKNLPIWTFHGEKDDVVYPSETTEVVKALRKIGSNVKMTLYPDLGHQIQSTVYELPEVYEWMLAQKKEAL